MELEHYLYERIDIKGKKQLPTRSQAYIRVASWNLTDYNSSEVFWHKKHLLCETIKRHDFDIVALQEDGEHVIGDRPAEKTITASTAAITELNKVIEALQEDKERAIGGIPAYKTIKDAKAAIKELKKKRVG